MIRIAQMSIRRSLSIALGLLFFYVSIERVSAQEPDGIVAREEPVVEPAGLADWPALARALKEPAKTEGRIVSFRELWAADPKLADEPVIVSGLVFRRFRREPVGQFPALEELWVRTDDDGLVVVTAQSRPRETGGLDRTEPGTPVRILAVFLRKVRYDAEDEPRIAPWLVAKRLLGKEGESESSGGLTRDTHTEWFVLIWATLAATAVLRVVVTWSRRSGRRPSPDSGEFRDEASSAGASIDIRNDQEQKREE